MGAGEELDGSECGLREVTTRAGSLIPRSATMELAWTAMRCESLALGTPPTFGHSPPNSISITSGEGGF